MSRLTIDKLMDIKHPSAPIWSRDSKRVAFMWDRAGVSNLYVASADGSTSPVAVTSDGAAVGGMFWSVDSTSIFFTREGRLMQVGLDGSSPPKTLWAAGFGAVPSPDGTRVAYAVGGDRGGGAPTLHVRGLPDGADASIGSFAGANGLFWRDANTLTVVIGGVGETINHDEAPSYSGAKLIFRTVENVPAAAPPQFALVPASGGEATRFSAAAVDSDGSTTRTCCSTARSTSRSDRSTSPTCTRDSPPPCTKMTNPRRSGACRQTRKQDRRRRPTASGFRS
jgi:hypothetical protein